MPEVQSSARVRPLDELDIAGIIRIDERITSQYKPDLWEQRVAYYLRRDPLASQVVEVDGKVVGFMLADVRAGEFGLEEPSGWVERFGIDPDFRGKDLGRSLFEAIVAHFRACGIKNVRTLVDQSDTGITGFLGSIGFRPSALQALEMQL